MHKISEIGTIGSILKERIRVVQMMYTFDVEVGGGGLSLFAIELGKKLDPEKFDVSLCSLGYYDSDLGQERIAKLEHDGIKAYETSIWDRDKPFTNFYNSQKYLTKELSSYPVDIIHSHSEYTDVSAILLKLQRKAPIILRTVHYGYQYEWSTKPLRRLLLTNFAYPILFDQEIGINQSMIDRLNNRKVARLFKRHAIRIPNAISLERFENLTADRSEIKISLGIPEDAFLIGTVGRLAEQKGYRYLIDAATDVIMKYPCVYFIIIGDGPLSSELKEQAKTLAIDRQVIFTGGRNDVEKLLRCLDLFVSSSLWEGLPTVILEAMASGLPILATDIPGTNELIQHAQNGWLVSPHDSQAISSAIAKLISSPQLTSDMAQRALVTSREYSIDSISQQYEVLYEELIARKE